MQSNLRKCASPTFAGQDTIHSVNKISARNYATQQQTRITNFYLIHFILENFMQELNFVEVEQVAGGVRGNIVEPVIDAPGH
jgi:hypothetical protein